MQQDQQAASSHRILPYDIVYCSSHDDPFPATELLKEEEDTAALRGWQSAKNCKYPQMIILRFPCDVELSQLQILSHECKIASKVEVRVFSIARDVEEPLNLKSPPTFKEVKYSKLGSVGFNSNEKSKYRSKERKTVHLKTVAYFLKLLFHKPHQNPLNVMQQVGVYSIACVGQLTAYPLPRHSDMALATPVPGQVATGGESPMSESGLPPIHHHAVQQLSNKSPARQHQQQQQHHHYQVDEHRSSPPPHPGPPALNNTASPANRLPPIDSKRAYNNPTSGNAQPVRVRSQQPYDMPHTHHLDVPGGFRSVRIMEFESFYVRRTHELATLKAEAIDVEDFTLAKDYKEQLIQLQQLSDQIYQLESHKVRAIYSEDFDEAKRVKRQMDECIETAYECCGGGTHPSSSMDAPYFPQGGGKMGGASGANRRGVSEDRPVVDMPPIDPTKQGSKHAFEDVPVRSKYASMMAAKAQEQQPEGGGGDENDNNNDDEDDPQQQSDGDEDSAPPTSGTRKTSNNNNNGGGSGGNPQHNQSGSGAEVDENDEAAVGIDMLPADGVFNISMLPKWEQEVYTAIHACVDELPAEAMLPPSVHTEASELQGVIGKYATCCLLSKRWKLREAAIRAITDHINTLFPNSVPTAVVTAMCRFLDFKNCGLQDSISNVVVASCAFLQMVLKGGVVECPIQPLMPNLSNMFPRLVFRASENLAKIRDPVIATILVFAECPEFGVDRVVSYVSADPVDQDKRRISNHNSKVQIARLVIVQQLLDRHKGAYNFSINAFDHFMSKLMLPCLNHQNNEVRDLSVKVMALIDTSAQDFGKYLAQVQNPAVLSTLQRSSSSTNMAAGEGEEKREKKRNSSAQKKSGKRSVDPH